MDVTVIIILVHKKRWLALKSWKLHVQWTLCFRTLYFKTTLIKVNLVPICGLGVLVELFLFKTTCHTKPHFQDPISGLKMEGSLYTCLHTWCIIISKHSQGPKDLHPGGVHGDKDHALLTMHGSTGVGLAHEYRNFTPRIHGTWDPDMALKEHTIIWMSNRSI